MLVVTAEIWPGGDEDRAVRIGEIQAANISDLRDVSSYAVDISEDGYEPAGLRGQEHQFKLMRHERKRGVWELVRLITNYRSVIENDVDVTLGVVTERASKVLGGPMPPYSGSTAPR